MTSVWRQYNIWLVVKSAALCRGHLLALPQLLLFTSHLQTCLRAVLARVEDPTVNPVVRFRSPRSRLHNPYTPSLYNPVHLWYLSLAWLRAKLCLQLCRARTAPGCTPLASGASILFASGSTPVQREDSARAQDMPAHASAEAEVDAEAALHVLHAHTASLMLADSRAQRKAGRGDTSALSAQASTTTFSALSLMAGSFDESRATTAAEQQLQLFMDEAALTPAALLAQPFVQSACGHLFLAAEHAAFEAVYTALTGALHEHTQAAANAPQPRGVHNAAVTLEVLAASKKEFASELVALSKACTGLYMSVPAASASKAAALDGELLITQQRVIGRAAAVFVGALARAFPPHMSVDDALTCILDMARSRQALRQSHEGLLPPSSGGAFDRFSGAQREWMLASDAGEVPRDWQQLRSPYALNVLGASPGNSPHAPGTPQSANASGFFTPRTTVSEPDAWATVASASAMLGEGHRSTAVAALMAAHGGWTAACLGEDSQLAEQPHWSAAQRLQPLSACSGAADDECVGREEDVQSIVSQVEGGAEVIVVTGVHGAFSIIKPCRLSFCLFQLTDLNIHMDKS